MKKLLSLIIIFIIFSTHAQYAYALTPAPTAKSDSISPTTEAINEKLNTQINQLKDKIASRVSELNLVEKKGIIGTVTETATSKITLTDTAGNSKQVDIDEITKFSSSTVKGTFGLSDLTRGSKISVVGLYNKQSKRILARFISTSVNPIFLSGIISEIDSKNLTFTLVSEDQKKTKIDVESTTKILSYDKDQTASKILFAKISSGDRIILVGFPDKKNSEMILSDRIVVLTDAPKNPKISVTIPSPTDTPVPSPTAAVIRRNITPIIKN